MTSVFYGLGMGILFILCRAAHGTGLRLVIVFSIMVAIATGIWGDHSLLFGR